MDSITHVLSAALWTEPIPPPAASAGRAYARWRERLAVIAGALLPDADGILGFFSLLWYQRYHRLVTHSIIGMIVIGVVAALLAKRWPEKALLPSMRHKSDGPPVLDPSFLRLLGLSYISVATHFVGDWIAAWGIWPFWPFSKTDYALRRVNSIDAVLLTITIVAWALQNALLSRGKRPAAWGVAAVWLAICAAYVYLRPHFAPPPFI